MSNPTFTGAHIEYIRQHWIWMQSVCTRSKWQLYTRVITWNSLPPPPSLSFALLCFRIRFTSIITDVFRKLKWSLQMLFCSRFVFLLIFSGFVLFWCRFAFGRFCFVSFTPTRFSFIHMIWIRRLLGLTALFACHHYRHPVVDLLECTVLSVYTPIRMLREMK